MKKKWSNLCLIYLSCSKPLKCHSRLFIFCWKIHKEMLSILISKYTISPQSVLPKLFSWGLWKMLAGRSSLLNISFQHLCLLLIIFNASENARKDEETPYWQCILWQNNQFSRSLLSKIQIFNISSLGSFPKFCLVRLHHGK